MSLESYVLEQDLCPWPYQEVDKAWEMALCMFYAQGAIYIESPSTSLEPYIL